MAVSNITKFNQSLSGYDPKEVDSFLERIMVEYKKMQKNYAMLSEKQKNDTLKFRQTQFEMNEESKALKQQIFDLKQQLESRKENKSTNTQGLLFERYREQAGQLKAAQDELMKQRAQHELQIEDLKMQFLSKNEPPSSPNPQAVANALIEAEELAIEIVQKAEKEAERLVRKASEDAEKICTAAQIEMDNMTAQLEKIKAIIDYSKITMSGMNENIKRSDAV